MTQFEVQLGSSINISEALSIQDLHTQADTSLYSQATKQEDVIEILVLKADGTAKLWELLQWLQFSAVQRLINGLRKLHSRMLRDSMKTSILLMTAIEFLNLPNVNDIFLSME